MATDNPNQIKHLEFIQLTITRMAANSFLLKAWGVTLVAALFALAAKDAEKQYVVVSYIPAIAFWILDGFYLHQERLFRRLYDKVRLQAEVDVDYSMKTAEFVNSSTSWPAATLSRTLLVFYGSLVAVTVLVTFVI